MKRVNQIEDKPICQVDKELSLWAVRGIQVGAGLDLLTANVVSRMSLKKP